MNVQKQIQNHLKTLGLSASYMPGNLSSDAAIEIDKTDYHIQLGDGYVCLCRYTYNDDGELRGVYYEAEFFGPKRVDELINTLDKTFKH